MTPAESSIGGSADSGAAPDFDLLPNTFIIGAAKSGTTSLFEILAQHPAVFTPKAKEPRFFSYNDHFANGLRWYQDTHFAEARGFAVRLEASTAYLTWSEKVAPRIKAAYGDRPLRFIAIFREPGAAAYSHYWHRVRQGDEDPRRLDFAGAIHTEEQRLKDHWQRLEYDGNGLFGYFRAGCYATRLEPFLRTFPRERFFFLLQEDLQREFQTRMGELIHFLGLPEVRTLRPVVANESAVPRSRRASSLFKAVKQSSWRGAIKRLVPKPVRGWFRYRALVRPFAYPPMPADMRAELHARYRDEVDRLASIMNRDLSHWKGVSNPVSPVDH